MSIRRPPLPVDRFVIIDNAWLRDPALSYRAKGILAYIATHAAGHELTVEQIVAEGTEGREAVRTALGELEAAGYLVRTPRRADNRIVGTDFELRDPRATAQEPVASSDQHRCSVCAAQPSAQKPTARKSPPKKTTSSEDQEDNTSFDADASPNAGMIVKGFIDWLAARDEPIKLTPSVIARYGKAIKALLAANYDTDTIKRALALQTERGKAGWPSMLDSFCVEVQNRPVSAPPAAPRTPQFKSAAEQNRERQRITKLRARLADRIVAERGLLPVDAISAVDELTDEQVINLMTTSTVGEYSGVNVIEGEEIPPEVKP